MTEDELIFVSKNYMKLKEVKEKLATLDVNVISKNYKFFEQLENDLFCITVDKAISAYNDILKPLIVMDTGFYVKNYPNNPDFPGAFIKTNLLDTIGIKGLLENMKNVTDRKCFLKECLAYYDGDNFKVFESSQEGTLAYSEYQGTNIDKYTKLFGVFIPEGYSKTVGEMSSDEKDELAKTNPNVLSLFANWYKKERSKCLVKK